MIFHDLLHSIEGYTKEILFFLAYGAIECWLGVTTKTHANSIPQLIGEIIIGFGKRLFKIKENKIVNYSKDISLGSSGKLNVSEANGLVTLRASQALGDIVGLSAEIKIDAVHLIDAGFEVAKQKFPGIASMLDAARVAIDHELGKDPVPLPAAASQV